MKKTVNLLTLRESGELEDYAHQTAHGLLRLRVPADVSACSRGYSDEAIAVLTARPYLLAYGENRRVYPIREQFSATEWATLSGGSFSFDAVLRRGIVSGVNGIAWENKYFCVLCGEFYNNTPHHCGKRQRACDTCGAVLKTKDEKTRGTCTECQKRLVNRVAPYHSRWTRSTGEVFFEQEANRDDTLHMGAEIEVDASYNYDHEEATAFSDIFNNNPFAPFVEYERDGSLNGGCECITAPTTAYGYERRAEQFTAFYDKARNDFSARFKTSNGLHFHLDRDFFGDETNTTKSAIALQVMIYKYYNFFIGISGREAGCAYYASKKDGCETFIDTAVRFNNTAHRDAVNTQNPYTIELRFFGGHIDTGEKFLACVDIANALAKWAKRATLASIDKATPLDIVRYIKNGDRVKRYFRTLPSNRARTTDGEKMLADFITALDAKGGVVCA